jgi:trimethylamine--corrinoid protein Co-methyltransferase
MLESMLAVAPEQYVIDDDILGMALRALSGIRVDEETLAVEVIERVGPGGHFLTQPHTLKFARSGEFFVPKTADRGSRADWEKAGRPDPRKRAQEIAREIFSRPRPQLIPEEIDSDIRKRFRILLPRT